MKKLVFIFVSLCLTVGFAFAANKNAQSTQENEGNFTKGKVIIR